MKKTLYYLFIVLLMGVSCKKESHGKLNLAIQKYNISFSLSGWSPQIKASAAAGPNQHLTTNSITADTSNNDSLQVIYYLVRDDQGKIVSFVTQNSSSPNFGNISEQLPAGSYYFYFVAGKAGLSVDQYYYTFGYPNGAWQDTFFRTFKLTVSGSPINQNVYLERWVGELEVDIQDAIPKNAKEFIISLNPEPGGYFMLADTNMTYSQYPEVPRFDTIAVAQSDIGKTNHKLAVIVGNTFSPKVNIGLICLDNLNNVIGGTDVQAPFKRNRRTIMSGKLFGSVTDTFHVSLNNAWDLTPFRTINF